ncbi:MAG TPA: dihydroorotase [Patescibacteria group bacterium]|nr:dihydroorotase [Patescibacteria group bacterium]
MSILIKNGRVIDPSRAVDAVMDVLVEKAKISKVAANITQKADTVIDAGGKIVMPGIVDMHVHLREPGREDKETIASGTRAAAKGGVTSVLAMPNTDPAMDSSGNIRLLQGIIKKTAGIDVFICGAITAGRAGKKLVEVSVLKRQGVIAISDDGASVDAETLMRQALQKAKTHKILVIAHCEDKLLSGEGVVNAGFTSTRLGLRGLPRESEYRRVERDVGLAKKTRAAIHIAHVSCRESVEIIADAKKKGVSVTAETAPHYFSLTEEALLGYDTNMKMNPPLRSPDDIRAIKEGLQKGVIDVIASDHAPHTENEKDIEFDRAAFGVIGLETELAVSITELVRPGLLSWTQLVAKCATNPGRILGIGKGSLAVGCDADIAVVAADTPWTVRKEDIVSKSKNSPFLGSRVYGTVACTISRGRIVYADEASSHPGTG